MSSETARSRLVRAKSAGSDSRPGSNRGPGCRDRRGARGRAGRSGSDDHPAGAAGRQAGALEAPDDIRLKLPDDVLDELRAGAKTGRRLSGRAAWRGS